MHASGGSENLTKFSVEIVQQLEFTTSAANSHPQQISTNVTVKALTNASVKSEQGAGGGGGNNNNNSNSSNNNNNNSKNGGENTASPHMRDLGNIVDFKQEPDNDFADLESVAVGHFPGLPDLIGDDTNEGDDTFKELMSDLGDFPTELLNFEEKPIEVKLEDGLQNPNQFDSLNIKSSHSPMTQYGSAQFNDNSMKRGPYAPDGSLNELSPAAQTLKHMAEQHQHKNAMNMNFVRQQQQQQNPRFNDFNQFNPNANDFLNSPANVPPNNQQQSMAFQKQQQVVPPFPGADLIKQEMGMFSSSVPNDFDLKRLPQMGGGGIVSQQQQQKQQQQQLYQQPPPPKQQQYSPYGSPGGGMSNHGSPAGANASQGGGPTFVPNRSQANPGPPPGQQQGNNANHNATTLQMKQTQQLHISQQGPGHNIQVGGYENFFQ